jgi:deazaflavin-dependent oxidoreductase (nitroreductase family)
MRDEVRAALAVDASSIEDRTIDITTTGRRSGKPRRIQVVFYRLEEDVYLSGIPAPKTRGWLANLAANPQFTLHLKHRVVADLPATATIILEPAERRRVLAVFVEQFNRRRRENDDGWPEAVLDEWVAQSPLAKSDFRRRRLTRSPCASSISR